MTIPTINLSMIPTFPAKVVGSGPVTITKAGLVYTFGWNIAAYSTNPSPNPAQVQLLGYNGATGATEQYPLSAIQTGLSITASQISDATANGRTIITGTQAQGRTALGLGDVSTLNVGTGLTADSGTVRLANSGVTAASYTITSVTFDVYGRATSASSVTPSAVLDQIGSTRGSVLYRGVSGWAILSPGTSGFVLKSNGAGADPSWVSNAAGKVLQVVQTVDTTNRSTTSASYTSTGISASITPASSSNSVRVTFTVNAGASASLIGRFAIFRGVTDITPGGKDSVAVYRPTTGDETAGVTSISFDLTDTPATTSSTTYTIQWKTTAGTMYLGRRGSDTTINTTSGVLTLEELAP